MDQPSITPTKILLVEDDPEISRIVLDHLRKEGFYVTWASTGKEGWEDFKAEKYDLVLVDLMLPEMDGYSLCQTIRRESEVPLLIISARQEEENKIRGLQLGADDYITKPFSLHEVTARINSHLRRYHRYYGGDNNQHLTQFIHGLTIDYQNEMVTLNSEQIMLTAKEKELLFLLSKNSFQVFSKEDLYKHVWQMDDEFGKNTVTVHVKGLRTKLKEDAKLPKFIQTVWGVGYRFIGEQQT